MGLQDRTCSELSHSIDHFCFSDVQHNASSVFFQEFCRFIHEEIYYFLLSTQENKRAEREEENIQITYGTHQVSSCKKLNENPSRTKGKMEMEVEGTKNQPKLKTPGEKVFTTVYNKRKQKVFMNSILNLFEMKFQELD